MATTRIIKRHISASDTIAQSLTDSFNYGQNLDKTKDGELVAAYMCDPETADAEFLLSKAQYKAITGREQKRDADVLCYQIRQSFAPGEVDEETALKIGYDMAMRWTKGKYAFFVCTHNDRKHIHNHIYYNSTALDCTRKFRDFRHSARAVRRLSDRICLENGLSVVDNPKLHSQGTYKHYGEWLNEGGKPMNWQQRLKAQIDNCLAEKPPDMAAFLSLMTAAGYEVKHGRGGVVSFRAEGQERFTRLRSSTLGNGYGLEDIQAIIDGKAAPSDRQRAAAPDLRFAGIGDASRKVSLVIDIQQRMREGKGPAYARWATIHNLKQMAAALQYIQENGLLDYEQLEKKAADASDRFHALSDKIKSIEGAIHTNAELKAASVDYAKTRPVFDGYKATKYSRKYLAEHEADIKLYRDAQATFRRILNGAKLPKMDTLKAEWQRLTAEKGVAYQAYKAAKKDMQDLVTAKANIDHLLGLTGGSKNKEQER